MTQNKEQIITDMLDNGLLSDEDAERYLADKYVTVAELEEIKRLIQLCRSRENSKLYPFEKIENKIMEKYFNNPSESVADDTEYTKQLIQLCEKSQREIDSGQEYSIDEVFDRIKQKYSTTESMTDSVRVGDDYSKEAQEAIEAIIRRGDEDMKNGRYMSEEEFINRAGISLDDEELKDDYEAIRRCEDDIKNGRLYTEEEFYKEIGLDLSLPPKSKTLKELLSRGDITQEEYEKYMSDDNFSNADAMEMKEIENIIREGDEDMKNGRYSPFEESWKRILADDDEAIRDCEDDIKNGRIHPFEETVKRFKGEYTPKAQTLKLLIDRDNITQDEYEKYLSDDNFSDADAMKRKGIEDIIRRGEEDLKNGNVESWEDTLKKIQEARKRILSDDYEAIRDCEDEAIKRIKKE